MELTSQQTTAAIKEVKSRGAAMLRGTLEAGEGFFYDMEATLKQIHGDGWKSMLTRGKLSFLSAIGEFEQTTDPEVTQRMKTASSTRFCLVKISEEMMQIATLVDSTTRHIGKVMQLLQRFRMLCDDPLNGYMAEGNDEGMIPPRRTIDAESERVLHSYTAKIQSSSLELQEMLRSNCAALIDAGREQIDEVYTAAVADVSRTQTEYDKRRHKRQVLERDLQNLMSKNDYASRDAARLVEVDIRRVSEDMMAKHSAYTAAVESAKTNIQFALEQSSMSTWSSFHVFFSQISTFFGEVQKESTMAAGACGIMKTGQNVSQQIIAEKRKQQDEYLQQANAAMNDGNDSFYGGNAYEQPSKGPSPQQQQQQQQRTQQNPHQQQQYTQQNAQQQKTQQSQQQRAPQQQQYPPAPTPVYQQALPGQQSSPPSQVAQPRPPIAATDSVDFFFGTPLQYTSNQPPTSSSTSTTTTTHSGYYPPSTSMMQPAPTNVAPTATTQPNTWTQGTTQTTAPPQQPAGGQNWKNTNTGMTNIDDLFR